MPKNIVIIQGHPDPDPSHYGHALADAYAQAARQAGHSVRLLSVATLDFPLLRRYEEFYTQPAPEVIQQCQEQIRWADHLVLFYPLWLGSMPALLKAFLEQVFRHGFAMEVSADGKTWRKLLKGKSARVVITMGMPAFAYRWYFGAHSLKSLERNILRFCGIKPVRKSLVGLVEGSARHRQRWLEKMTRLGRAGR
ncbi:MAG: NAD(P)H-dependent oxidoreductase [Gammaproteobacteria bacterium]